MHADGCAWRYPEAIENAVNHQRMHADVCVWECPEATGNNLKHHKMHAARAQRIHADGCAETCATSLLCCHTIALNSLRPARLLTTNGAKYQFMRARTLKILK
eukprot:1143502-Pelagomonas_calceolata.AAC.4